MKVRQRYAVVVVLAVGLIGAASASAAELDCSKPLTHDLTLTEGSSCANFLPLVIGADHVTVNLNGHGLQAGFGGPVIKADGHRFDTVENGTLDTQGTALVLNGTRRFTVRNVATSGDEGGISLTGGSGNRVLDSVITIGYGGPISIQLTRERNDVLRNNTSDSVRGCQLQIDQSWGIRVVGNTLGALVLQGSSGNRIVRNNIVRPSPPSPFYCRVAGGISGTGNFNLIRHNVISGSAITVTGFGNWQRWNTVQP